MGGACADQFDGCTSATAAVARRSRQGGRANMLVLMVVQASRCRCNGGTRLVGASVGGDTSGAPALQLVAHGVKPRPAVYDEQALGSCADRLLQLCPGLHGSHRGRRAS